MKIRVDEVQVGQTVKGNLVGGAHVVFRVTSEGMQMRTSDAKVLTFWNEAGEEFFVGRVYAKATLV